MAVCGQIEAGLRISAVKEYLGGGGSLNKIAKKYGVCHGTLQKWLLNCELLGEEGLEHQIHQKQSGEHGAGRCALGWIPCSPEWGAARAT